MAIGDPGWELWRSFEAVMREGSLSGAARVLGLTQPTVGRHIAELDDALASGALFTRSSRGLHPTALAAALRPHAQAMEASARLLLRTASAPDETVAGIVRISASEIVGAEVLPPLLSWLREDHPGLVLELVLSNASSDLLRRDADLAVRMVQPRQQALVSRSVGRFSLGMYAHRDYLLRTGLPQSIEGLASHALIGFDRDIESLQRVQAALGIKPVFALRTDNHLAQLAAVRSGFGIGLVQDAIAGRDPELVPVLAEQFVAYLECWVVMHEDVRRTRSLRVVFDALVVGLSAHAQAGRR